MSTKIASHNSRVRMLLFFARPLHIFNVILLFQMWNYMSFAPENILKYRGTATQAVRWLWQTEFSNYVWYFILAAIADIVVQEYLPLIRGDR